MTDAQFVPYWLIHEPGKDHGFAVVDLDSAITEEAAIDAFRNAADPVLLSLLDAENTQYAARLITEPFSG